MPKVKFENGVTVNFDSMPSQADIEEVASKFGNQSSQPSTPPNRLMTNPEDKSLLGRAQNFSANAVNDLADIGDTTIGAAKGLYNLASEHPLTVAPRLAAGAVKGTFNTLTHPKEAVGSFVDSIKNAPTKPASAALNIAGAGM